MPQFDLGRPLAGLKAQMAAMRNHVRLRPARNCLAVAAANLLHNGLRSAVALAGTSVPILLLILQLAMLQAVRTEVVRLYNDFNFDIAVVPSTYEFLMSNGTFDRIRLAQAREVPGIAGTFNLNVDSAGWTAAATKRRSPVILIGIDDDTTFIADRDIRAGMAQLGQGDAVLVDRDSGPALGALDNGTDATVNEHPVTIAGAFALGLFFYADGAVIVPNTNFPQIGGGDARQTSIGLIQVAPGSDIQRVKNDLARILPPDVVILPRAEFIAGEQAFFVTVKPLGIMMMVGMFVAALAGTVVLWQVLSAQIARRINEYATLSAMGFSSAFVLGVGLCETMLLGLAALAPALVIGAVILGLIALETHLPTAITPTLTLEVIVIVLGMCGLCAASVLVRISRAQPANLF